MTKFFDKKDEDGASIVESGYSAYGQMFEAVEHRDSAHAHKSHPYQHQSQNYLKPEIPSSDLMYAERFSLLSM